MIRTFIEVPLFTKRWKEPEAFVKSDLLWITEVKAAA